ncbi:hypothetical protein H4R33_003746 [Dimargaris cristalligena]|nr:hypothetical protein H4R33_003746 [Dimargaris cristalligena]
MVCSSCFFRSCANSAYCSCPCHTTCSCSACEERTYRNGARYSTDTYEGSPLIFSANYGSYSRPSNSTYTSSSAREKWPRSIKPFWKRWLAKLCC